MASIFGTIFTASPILKPEPVAPPAGYVAPEPPPAPKAQTLDDIMNMAVVAVQPTPTSSVVFKTPDEVHKPTQITQFPPPGPDLDPQQLTRYYMDRLYHGVTQLTVDRDLLKETWLHLKASPDTCDQLLPQDLNSITKALLAVTGGYQRVAVEKKTKVNVRATAKNELKSAVAAAFADFD
jgi:hypothetical protein